MEGAALGVEAMAVVIIVFGTVRYIVHVSRHLPDAFRLYKERLTKALLLGLEFLVAADIVRTVAIEQTLTSVAILGALVAVRTLLSWSLVVEIEGRWPWQVAGAGAPRNESA
jgi:uncharacterized membrane protein